MRRVDRAGVAGIAPVSPARTIADTRAAVTLFAPHLAGLGHEEMCFACLASDFRLLAMRCVRGTQDDAVALPLRAVIGEALRLDAWGLIVAHNHPGGSAEPSSADRVATRRLVEVARPLDIRLVDHLIFAGESVTSFHALGLL